MYAKRIQLSNYGPIEQLDISIPFSDEAPQPVLLVGENGAGKTILLSHIVNGLITAKAITYPDTPEVTEGKVYKVRSSTYITLSKQHYFGRVEFEDEHFISELHLRNRRDGYENIPAEIGDGPAKTLWDKAKPHENSVQDSSFSSHEARRENVKDLMRQRCVLYFPSDRFEEPAWLNELHLTDQPHRTHSPPYEGHTARRVIATSPLRNNQDWIYDVITDRSVFELQTIDTRLPSDAPNVSIPVTLLRGYSGRATNAFNQALQLLRLVVQDPQARFVLGQRPRRNVSIYSQDIESVPNIFQLSSGESALLNLGLSILRDADLSASNPTQASDIRGIVVIDEVDLHLHAVHQHEVLPSLLRMFPRVQFIVTTHSPLFVLGMQREFGEDGFSLYRLPEGVQVSSEEFSEFGTAYSAFQQSQAFGQDMRDAIREAVKPVVVVEGKTDKAYLEAAARFLDRNDVIEGLEIMDGGGAGKLKTLWDSLCKLPEAMMNKRVLILLDCDEDKPLADKGALHRRTIPFVEENPFKTGIENLLERDALERAIAEKSAFVDIRDEYRSTVRGEEKTVPAEWSVNADEKMNLCTWICDNSTPEDFGGFTVVLDLIDELLNADEEETEGPDSVSQE